MIGAQLSLKRLYKGKGKKGKCSNERGITLASNFGKLYERIINNRVLAEINITDAQAGGQKGRATTDHLLVLKELIKIAQNMGKPIHIVFLDVTKAYDKAWLDAIMYVMNKEGLKSNLWNLVRKLNQNLTARIQTHHGLTRPIQIRDSIRQGGVLSVAQYALLMDEINKEIEINAKGITVPNTEKKVGCLLWMDDVALISTEEKELQEMLNITNDISKRYHIEFGKAKSKVMTIGKNKKKKRKEQPITEQTSSPEMEGLKLGDMIIEPTESYKYLGEHALLQ